MSGAWVVVGGQYGSEGKGRIAEVIARDLASRGVLGGGVRAGGPNAGHTATLPDGRRYGFRQIPVAMVVPGEHRAFIGAGAVIDKRVLVEEMTVLGLWPLQVLIDRQATVLQPADEADEAGAQLFARIGSTQTGTGVAMHRRMLRDGDFHLACKDPDLAPMTGDVAVALSRLHKSGMSTVVEGTQGTFLSLYHGHYPYVTSRDTTVTGIMSECGIPPRDLFRTFLVIRTYPIRVAGNSGPIGYYPDVTWGDVHALAGMTDEPAEKTTVTKRVRRVGVFDIQEFDKAVALNGPSDIAVTGLDYLGVSNRKARSYFELNPAAQTFVDRLADWAKTPVTIGCVGPELEQTVWL